MNTKEKALTNIHRTFHAFLQDLEALPPDTFERSLGGKARTAADIVYEVNLTNDCLRLDMLGEPILDRPNAWVTAPEKARTKASAIASFRASSEQVIQTVEQMSLEEVEGVIRTDLGEMTRADYCRSMTVHLWYHSGQLNYIQTLLGDGASHWT